jgi:hypothetical protein
MKKSFCNYNICAMRVLLSLINRFHKKQIEYFEDRKAISSSIFIYFDYITPKQISAFTINKFNKTAHPRDTLVDLLTN